MPLVRRIRIDGEVLTNGDNEGPCRERCRHIDTAPDSEDYRHVVLDRHSFSMYRETMDIPLGSRLRQLNRSKSDARTADASPSKLFLPIATRDVCSDQYSRSWCDARSVVLDRYSFPLPTFDSPDNWAWSGRNDLWHRSRMDMFDSMSQKSDQCRILSRYCTERCIGVS